MSRKELEALGRAHAHEALDQVELYGSRENAVESYRDNLYDTATEQHFSADDLRVAEDAFERALRSAAARYLVETAPQYGEWQLVDTLNKLVVRKSFNRAELDAERERLCAQAAARFFQENTAMSKITDRTAKMAAVARRHPDWSLRMIEEHLNFKPRNDARAFRPGTDAYLAEVRRYNDRLATWKRRNARDADELREFLQG